MNTPTIKHVKGNVLRLQIPLTIKRAKPVGDKVVEEEEDFYPNPALPLYVFLYKACGIGKIRYEASIDGNIASIEDKGILNVGVYNIEVIYTDEDSTPYRYMVRDALEIVNATKEAGIAAGVEFEVETHSLDGAVFIDYSLKQVQTDWNENDTSSAAFIKNKPDLSVFQEKENGKGLSSNDFTDDERDKLASLVNYDDVEIREWLAKAVCGGNYNADTKKIELSDKDGKVLFLIDATAFVIDGMVESVTIEDKNLVITFNTDSGKRPIEIPLSAIFDEANYYNKEEVALLIEQATSDMATCAWVSEQGYLTEHQDVSGKEDRTRIVIVEETTELTAAVGTLYKFDVNVNDLRVTLPTINDDGFTKSVVLSLTTGDTPAVVFTSANDILYHKDFEINANSTYEINCLWNGSEWVLAAMEIETKTTEE